MVDWPIPANIKALRGFLGLTGYYRRFIKDYGKISSSLNALLKKDKFEWNEQAQQAFEALKQVMIQAPVLALPDFSLPFEIECDASGKGIGAILMQKGRPLAYLSKALGERNLSKSTYEKEMLAMILAIKKWEKYLVGHHFIIKTDHQSLRYFLQSKATSNIQQKWTAKLMGLDYEITYKKGAENLAADALSRIFEDPQIMAISYPYQDWLDEMRRETELDQWVINKKEEVTRNNDPQSKFTIDNGFVKYKGRIVMGPNSVWRSKIMNEMHSGVIGGHAGYLKTYKRIYKSFYWEGMKADIKRFITECTICQTHKYETIASPGLLQPLPIPETIWADISMDFIDGLPASKGKTTIWVIVDRLSKYAHFIALSHPYTAQTIAQLFIDQIFRLHGLPKNIVHDRDPVFMSKFWEAFWKLQGTKLSRSSGYHPQTDGQTEVVNRCLETYLRCFTSAQPSKWTQYLAWAEWCYNTSYHTSTKMTPFEIVYGQSPPNLPPYESGTTKLPQVEQALRDRNATLLILKHNLQEARNRMKMQADKKRSERKFEIGDRVYLKLIKYKQLSIPHASHHKLAAQYYGPYEVLEKIGSAAYKLRLPIAAKIHNIFHVSRLKKCMGEGSHAEPTLPPTTEDEIYRNEPVAVLETGLVKKNNRASTELLVQWSNSGPESATWEEYGDLRRRFPFFNP